MTGFVQPAGIHNRASSALNGAYSNICGQRVMTKSASSTATGITSMTLRNNYGITLQRLIYEPNVTYSSISDKDTICNLVWKQVFGNAYVMESERAEAYIAESMYRAGQIPLREFVRGVAQTETYRRRFFECCGPYRAVELNFKHLLARAPNSQEEISEHVQRIVNEGYEAEINSYIDSEEYNAMFGDDYVPGMTFKGTYPTIEEFNGMCSIYSAPGTTDKSLSGRARAIGISNPNHVLSLDGAGVPSKTVSKVAVKGRSSFVNVVKGIPKRPDLDLGQFSGVARSVPTVINENASPKRRYEISMGNYMYLTADEAAEYLRDDLQAEKVTGLAQKELRDAETQLVALQARIDTLRAVI